MKLKSYTIDELEKELQRRRIERERKPARASFNDVDWTEVYNSTVTAIDRIFFEGMSDNDVQRIFRDCLIAVYGNDILEWIFNNTQVDYD